MRNSMRSMRQRQEHAHARRPPTKISARLGMAGTWLASTCKSGSATVMMKPSKKASTTTTHSFLLPVMAEPTRSPMGVMESSAPRVKNIIPTRMSTVPTKKQSRMPEGMGAMEKQSSSTTPTMGSTACIASVNFSFRALRFSNGSPRCRG